MSAPMICIVESSMSGKGFERMVMYWVSQSPGDVGKTKGDRADLDKPCSPWAHEGASNEVTIDDRLLHSLQRHASNL